MSERDEAGLAAAKAWRESLGEHRSAWTPEVRERFVVGGMTDEGQPWDTDAEMQHDLRAALSHIDAMEARVAVLAAECRARRALAAAYSNQSGYLDKVDAVAAARAATDAARALS